MINIRINGTFEGIDVEGGIKKSIMQSTSIIQKKAIRNAPRLTGALRNSIMTKNIKETGKVYSKLPYARRREYENKKNPQKRFYMKKALEKSINGILRIFEKNLK